VTGNLVLQDTLERLFVQNLYADVERGLFLVRGENVTLLGEIVRPPIVPIAEELD
jgi:U6 snRNA-associated Sm-like protein LSm1